jgi:hypothetical protein
MLLATSAIDEQLFELIITGTQCHVSCVMFFRKRCAGMCSIDEATCLHLPSTVILTFAG